MTDAERFVAETATFVGACRAVGATALTPAMITDLYATESGLRLDALAADSAALAAAADSAEEALSAGRSAAAVLEQAWRGGTGSAAMDFLDRQCRTAGGLVSDLHEAAAVLDTLRGTLARVIADKADTAVRIGERPGPHRRQWLADAAAVAAGAGDPAAVDTVTQRIAPYVQTGIAGEWVTAMTAATDTARTAYAAAVGALDAGAEVRFETPATPSTPAAAGPPVRPDLPGVPPPAPAAAPQWAPGLSSTAPQAWGADALGPGPFGGMPAPVSPAAGISPGVTPGITPSEFRAPHLDGFRDPDAPLAGRPFPDKAPEAAVTESDSLESESSDPDSSGPESSGPDASEPDSPESVSPDPVPSDPEPSDPAPPAPAPGQPPPLLAAELPAPAPAEAPAEPAADERTPCEIAADELAQVGQ